jgi:hypothetical protein
MEGRMENRSVEEIVKSCTIDCTGDVCAGDIVVFEVATFSGSWRSPKFAGNETVVARVDGESYGASKQQHTFTLWRFDKDEPMRIKGRNLYRNGVKRAPWADEASRNAILEEKHNRGSRAREIRSKGGDIF